MAEDNLETSYTRRDFLKLLGIGAAGAALTSCTFNLATKGFVVSAGSDASDVDLSNKKTQYPANKPQYLYINNGYYWGQWYNDGRWHDYRICRTGTPLPWGDVPLMNGSVGSYRWGPWKP